MCSSVSPACHLASQAKTAENDPKAVKLARKVDSVSANATASSGCMVDPVGLSATACRSKSK